MGFFGSYGTARDTYENLGDQARTRARNELSDREAAAARLEQIKQLEILRNMPQVQEVGEFETPQPAAVQAPQPAPAGVGSQSEAARLQQLRTKQPEAPNQSEAETRRLTRNPQVPQVSNTGNLRLRTPGSWAPLPMNEAERLAEMRRLNPVEPTANQTPVEDARLARQAPVGRTAAAGSAYDAPTPYDGLISQSAQQYGLNPQILKRLLGTESSFNPNAVGAMTPQGQAHGIAQIMTQVHGVTPEQARDPKFAIPFAAKLLGQYLQKVGGNYELALQMYKGAASEQGKAAMAGPIAKILTGLVPAATAQAAETAPGQAPAQAQPAAQPPVSQANQAQIEQAIQYRVNQARAQMQQLQQLAQVTRNPAEVLKIQGQYNDLNNSIREQQLFAAYTRGQITPEQYRLASLQEQQRVAAENAKLREEVAKAQGKIYEAAGTAPYKLQEIEATGLMNIQKALAENGMKLDDVQGVTRAQDGNPALVYTRRGVFVMQQTPPTKFGPGSTQLVPVPMAPQTAPAQVQQLQP